MYEATDEVTLVSALREAAFTELEHVRALGADNDLVLLTANLGGYECVLNLLASGESGVPVYQLISSVKSRYASHAGLISRIRMLRERGLLEERVGKKKSQVLLAPSKSLIDQLGPILINRNA